MANTTYNQNSSDNVSVGKGVKGGYFFSVEATATNLAKISSGLSDFTKKVTDVFTDAALLGFITEDGWVIAEDRSTDSIVDVNGDTIATSTSSYTETTTATLVEMKASVLKEMYGQDNVTDLNGLLTAYHTSGDLPERIYIADLVLKNERKWRHAIPKGQITELGDLTIASGDLVGREVTITGNSYTDANDKSYVSVDFMESTETGATTTTKSS